MKRPRIRITSEQASLAAEKSLRLRRARGMTQQQFGVEIGAPRGAIDICEIERENPRASSVVLQTILDLDETA